MGINHLRKNWSTSPASPTSPALPASSAFTQKTQSKKNTFKRNLSFRLTGLLVLSCVGFGNGAIALAQITPDATLGTEASRMQQNGVTDQIEGGAARGESLFHSFEEFNVGEGRQVYFDNPDGIEYIFSRVTGNRQSNILGTLGVLGQADLFLLNPNGIVFGPNAQLDVNGSFLAGTGDGILFPAGVEFSAVNPQAPPLLTMRAPIGLQYGANPGAIRVEGTGNNLKIASETVPMVWDNRPVGLPAPSGETLALIGGEVSLVGGNLTAASGRIELGSVGGDSTVNLSPDPQGWRLGYETVQNFRNIELTEAASVDASGLGAGAIRVRGHSISLQDGSALLAGTLGSGSGASLILQAEEAIALSGANANGFVSTLQTDIDPAATGNAGDLTIATGRLMLRDGAFVSASTLGQGNGGALIIRAAESVELSGVDGDGNSSRLLARVNPGAPGNAGDLTITTGRLMLRDGGRVSASINGDGNGGALTIRAAESLELSGADGNGVSSRFLTRINEGGAGNAGDLTIETGRLILRDGAAISASTSGEGNGGALTIRAAESVELSGVKRDGDSSRLATQVNREATGNAGDLTIETRPVDFLGWGLCLCFDIWSGQWRGADYPGS